MPETTRTVDDALRRYAVIFSGRTRYEGQEPRDDELLVEEIERLRSIVTGFAVREDGDPNARSMMDSREFCIRELAAQMTKARRAPADVEAYLMHGEYGLALDALGKEIMANAGENEVVASEHPDYLVFTLGRAHLLEVEKTLEQAQACLLGETPENGSHEEARADTLERVRAALLDHIPSVRMRLP